MAPRPTIDIHFQNETDWWFYAQLRFVIFFFGPLLGYVIADQVFHLVVSPTPEVCEVPPTPKPQAPATKPSVFGTEGAKASGDIYSDGWGDFDKITE